MFCKWKNRWVVHVRTLYYIFLLHLFTYFVWLILIGSFHGCKWKDMIGSNFINKFYTHCSLHLVTFLLHHHHSNHCYCYTFKIKHHQELFIYKVNFSTILKFFNYKDFFVTKLPCQVIWSAVWVLFSVKLQLCNICQK